MVKAKGKGKALTSGSKPKKKDATNNANAETSGSEPLKMEAEAPATVSGGEQKREENKKEEAKNEDKVENTPNKKGNKMRRRKKKKAIRGGADVVPAKDANKPETSERKKDSKKADSMGMVFMCSSKTKKDCYRHKVLGLPASKKELVAKVYKGMRLFLFDIDLRLMYGIYKAAGPGGYNIEPKAFKSAFPSQVRFTVLEDCLPLAEEKFKSVIKDNYYGKNKFDCQLKSEQVKNLCKLFRVTTKSPRSKRVGRTSRTETRMFEDRDRTSRTEARMFVDRGRTSRTEARMFEDRDRDRWQGQDGVRRPALGGGHLYPEGPLFYEREAFASPVPPPPLPPPSYAYERQLDMDYYRRNAQVEHHDRMLIDLELRRREEIIHRDPYAYRDPPPPPPPPPYRDPLYTVGLPPGYPPPPLYRY